MWADVPVLRPLHKIQRRKSFVKKNMIRMMLVICAAFLISGAAFASDASDGIQPPEIESDYNSNVNVSDVQTDRFSVAVTDTASAAKQILILALTDNSANVVPTADNIVYIDQDTADATGAVSFAVFPKTLTNGNTYYLYLSSDAEAGKFNTLTRVGSFAYGAVTPGGDLIYGDLDGDDNVTVLDAAFVVNAVAGIQELTDEQKILADVDGTPGITVMDAAFIINFVAGLQETLGPSAS